MALKSTIRLLLLGFVLVSVTTLVVKNAGSGRQEPKTEQSQVLACNGGVCGGDTAAGASIQEHKVIAYYFHGTARCTTCRTIEAYTREAIETSFAADLKQGRLEIRAVNIDEPENQHFVDDFQLSTRSVVVSELASGKQVRWKNLDKVWELVRQKAAFETYIQGEVRGFLEATA